MTAQIPEQLIVEHPGLDFGKRYLYQVVVGNPADGRMSLSTYRTIARPAHRPHVMSTALYRGCVSTYRLDAAGNLFLSGFSYPRVPARRDSNEDFDPQHEMLTGHFWLDLRHGFFTESLYVPFVDGQVQCDRHLWIEDPPKDQHPLAHLRRP